MTICGTLKLWWFEVCTWRSLTLQHFHAKNGKIHYVLIFTAKFGEFWYLRCFYGRKFAAKKHKKLGDCKKK